MKQFNDETETVARQYNHFQQSLERLDKKEKYLNYGYTVSRSDTYEQRQERLCREVFNAASIGPEDVIVDVGFGSGEQDFLLARERRFGRLIGFNIADRQVEYARERARRQGLDGVMSFFCDEAEVMGSAEDGAADRVLAIECAFYFNRPKFYRTASRVLKKGGLLVAADICFSDALTGLTKARKDLETFGHFSGNRREWEQYFHTRSVRSINRHTRPGAQMTVFQILAKLRDPSATPDERRAWRSMAVNTQVAALGFLTRLIRYDLIVLEKK